MVSKLARSKWQAAKVVVLGPKCASQGVYATVIGPKFAHDPAGTVFGRDATATVRRWTR